MLSTRKALLLAAVLLPPPAVSAAPYLVTDHDPAVLEELAKYTKVAESRGRLLLVEPSAAFSEIPAALAAKLRPVDPAETYYGPADAAPGLKARDPATVAVLAKVDQARLAAYADAITMTGRRGTASLDTGPGSGNRQALEYIAKTFRDLGYAVEQQCYKQRKADKECNVVARRQTGAKKAVLVVGHMDSVNHENSGADDNASGAAGVLEMARVLAQFKSDHDLIFVAANGEETGILGSAACAKKMKETGEISKIVWAVNMDMIAYDKAGKIDIETNKEYEAEANWLASLARTYTRQEPVISMPAWGSDHVPFLEAGIPTYLSIEHWDNHNPCYHRPCDKMEGLRWDYAADIVRLNLAAIAGKAKLAPLKN